MYILDIKGRKIVWIYTILTTLAILINHIYGYFGHGVHSMKMTLMFLYPLLGGALFYLAVGWIFPKDCLLQWYRLFCNLHNSGIASLTVGSFLNGIFEIAGTSSEFVRWFYLTGWLFVGIGIILLLASKIRHVHRRADI